MIHRVAGVYAVLFLFNAVSISHASEVSCLSLERIVNERGGNHYTRSGAIRQSLSRCFGRVGNADKAIRYFKAALNRWEREGKLKSFLAYKYEELSDLLEDRNRLREAWDARRYADDLRMAR